MALTLQQLEYVRHKYFKKHLPYKMVYFADYDFEPLKRNVLIKRRPGRGDKKKYNDIILMADTETSRSPEYSEDYRDNYVVAWTISIRAFGCNIVTLYGGKPSELVDTLVKIARELRGDTTICYFHNLSYDWSFLRKFFFDSIGFPSYQLNTKSHYPIMIEWESAGLILKDSYILSQKSLEKWAKDLDVEHQKAKGKWDYSKIRHQNEIQFLSSDELEYIEHDTLAGVECLDAMCIALHRNVFQLPLTATGIPREEVRKRGAEHKAHDDHKKMQLTYLLYCVMLMVYHGGYTHTNRHLLGVVINWVRCYDFASSYPYVLLAYKYPTSGFYPIDNIKDIKQIFEQSENYAFVFKVTMFDVKLKDFYTPMPVMQVSKLTDSINISSDNGRVLTADYVSFYTNEVDAEELFKQYQAYGGYVISEVYYATKAYLPRWFTDYIFELFQAKTMLKGGDPVLYALAKAKLNSLYGLCCQRMIQEDIVEDYDSGDYSTKVLDQEDLEKLFNKKNASIKTVLSYTWGVWCTSYAQRNLFRLGSCVKDEYDSFGRRTAPSHWIYSDTDSIYSDAWDEDKVKEYNESCKALLRANGYGPVVRDGREYWLGVAETSEDDLYSEYKAVGAKRYCGRSAKDGMLHITVAGVPKRGAIALDENIDKFAKGFVFSGTVTGKLAHAYINVEKIYINKWGDECGDSLDLTEVDYKLDEISMHDEVEEYFNKMNNTVEAFGYEFEI